MALAYSGPETSNIGFLGYPMSSDCPAKVSCGGSEHLGASPAGGRLEPLRGLGAGRLEKGAAKQQYSDFSGSLFRDGDVMFTVKLLSLGRAADGGGVARAIARAARGARNREGLLSNLWGEARLAVRDIGPTTSRAEGGVEQLLVQLPERFPESRSRRPSHMQARRWRPAMGVRKAAGIFRGAIHGYRARPNPNGFTSLGRVMRAAEGQRYVVIDLAGADGFAPVGDPDEVAVVKGAGRTESWRDGEKHHQGPWDCPKCSTHNVAGAFYCSQCKNPSEEMQAMMEEEKRLRAADEGRGGGLYDRQDPNDKNQWDSDGEEFDEFGRRKKRRNRGPTNKNKKTHFNPCTSPQLPEAHWRGGHLHSTSASGQAQKRRGMVRYVVVAQLAGEGIAAIVKPRGVRPAAEVLAKPPLGTLTSFRLWLETVGLVEAVPAKAHSLPDHIRAQGYTVASWLPIGDQELFQFPSLIDACAHSPRLRFKVYLQWAVAVADHAALVIDTALPVFTRARRQQQVWRCSDERGFMNFFAARCPKSFRDHSELLAKIRVAMGAYQDTTSRKQRRADREPFAIKALRRRVREAPDAASRGARQRELWHTLRRHRAQRKLAHQRLRVSSGGVVASSKALSVVEALRLGPVASPRVEVDPAVCREEAAVAARAFVDAEWPAVAPSMDQWADAVSNMKSKAVFDGYGVAVLAFQLAFRARPRPIARVLTDLLNSSPLLATVQIQGVLKSKTTGAPTLSDLRALLPQPVILQPLHLLLIDMAGPLVESIADDFGVSDRALGNSKGRQCLDVVFPLQLGTEAAADPSTEHTVIAYDIKAYCDNVEPLRVATCLTSWGADVAAGAALAMLHLCPDVCLAIMGRVGGQADESAKQLGEWEVRTDCLDALGFTIHVDGSHRAMLDAAAAKAWKSFWRQRMRSAGRFPVRLAMRNMARAVWAGLRHRLSPIAPAPTLRKRLDSAQRKMVGMLHGPIRAPPGHKGISKLISEHGGPWGEQWQALARALAAADGLATARFIALTENFLRGRRVPPETAARPTFAGDVGIPLGRAALARLPLARLSGCESGWAGLRTPGLASSAMALAHLIGLQGGDHASCAGDYCHPLHCAGRQWPVHLALSGARSSFEDTQPGGEDLGKYAGENSASLHGTTSNGQACKCVSGNLDPPRTQRELRDLFNRDEDISRQVAHQKYLED
ncbi:unnamed protein product, partial [Prorocentrum cordatum]